MSRPAGATAVGVLLWAGGVGAAAISLLGAGVGPVDASLVAHVAGLTAAYLSAVMVLLMSRAPWLERHVGSDALARWHIVGGRVFLCLVVVHAGAALEAWVTGSAVSLPAAVGSFVGLPWIPAAAAGLTLCVVVATLSIRAARRRVTYETWHGLHLLTYVAVALSFPHELGGASFAGHSGLQVAWTLMHCYVLALVVRFRLLRPLEDAWRHRMRVAAVVPEAEGVASIIVRGRHLHELAVQPGQFLRWRFLAPGVWRTAHPFSLSAPPHGDYLRITVKAFGAGSRRLQAVRPGTRILAEGPSGTLTARRRRTGPHGSVLLVAGGAGITPMRTLFETLYVAPPGRLTLLYRASRPADVLFRGELERIAAARGADIVWMVGPSTDPALAMTGANLARLVPDVARCDVFLCAPPRLSHAVRAAVREVGVPSRCVHEEVFDVGGRERVWGRLPSPPSGLQVRALIGAPHHGKGA